MEPVAHHQDDSQSGFSLVEMLVVLAVIGFISSIVLLNGGSTEPGLDREADRFAAKLAEARDLALIRNRPVLVEVTPDGYALRQRTADGWAVAGRTDAVDWESGSTIQVEGARLPAHILFDPMGMSEAGRISLYRGEDAETIVLDGTGAVHREGDRDG